MSKPVLYVGVFLQKTDRERLLLAVPPRHETVHADHLTLIFRPSKDEFSNYVLGVEQQFLVVGEVFDEKGQAVLVTGVDSKNAYPHITISTAIGTKPVYSNELFVKSTVRVFDEPVRLVGIVDAFPPQKRNTEEIANG